MTNEEIEELLNVMLNGSSEDLVKYINDEKLKQKIEEIGVNNVSDELENQATYNLVGQIEAEGYEYWTRLLMDFADSGYIDGVIEYTSNLDFIKQAVKDETLELMDSNRLKLIKFLGNDFAEEVLKDETYNLSDENKVELIKMTDNIDLARKLLDEEGKSLPRLKISSRGDLVVFIGDEELARKYINKGALGFDKWEIRKVIKGLKSVNLAREYIYDENRTFTMGEVAEVISSTENPDFALECIYDEKLNLDKSDKKRIIKTLKNPDLAMQIMLDEKIGFEAYDKYDIIETINDIEFSRECIYDERLGLNNSQKAHIIAHTKDIDFIREYLNDDKLDFEQEYKVLMISSTRNIDFINECFEDEKLSFNEGEKGKIIVATENIEYIKSCINNEELGLKDKDFENIIISLSDRQIAQECVNSIAITECLKNKLSLLLDIEQNEDKTNSEVLFDLPSNMTIGMEIECEGSNSRLIASLFEYRDWQAKGDGSLQNGIEIVSPILHSTEQDTKEIYTVTGMLNVLEQTVSERCGGHIHIGADYLTSVQAYENLMELWCNNEKALYAMSNEKGITPRNGVTHYAPPLSSKMHDAMENGTINLENEASLDEFVKGLKEMQGERYSGLNLLNVNNEKNTIEFRLANGTLNPEMWIENANLFGGMVAISEDLAQIQKNGVRTEEDKHKQEIFDKLKQDIDEKEKVEILLELAGVEPETYMERYEANIDLIKENQEMEEVFAGKEPLDFKAAKEKFKGKESQEIESSAHAQQEAMENIVEGHERNLQNVREDRNYIH